MKKTQNDLNAEFKSKYDIFISGAFFLLPGVYWFYIVFTYGIV